MHLGNIEVFDNVFIQTYSIIKYNVKIEFNTVVAAGSVAAIKDVLEGSIVGGNPTKVIRYVDELTEKRAKKFVDMLF